MEENKPVLIWECVAPIEKERGLEAIMGLFVDGICVGTYNASVQHWHAVILDFQSDTVYNRVRLRTRKDAKEYIEKNYLKDMPIADPFPTYLEKLKIMNHMH